jgi:hypothetical protein
LCGTVPANVGFREARNSALFLFRLYQNRRSQEVVVAGSPTDVSELVSEIVSEIVSELLADVDQRLQLTRAVLAVARGRFRDNPGAEQGDSYQVAAAQVGQRIGPGSVRRRLLG